MILNYKRIGVGEQLIILHGLFGMLDNWQTIARKLSQQYEVFTIDLRNHGKSPHADEHNYAVMARDIYDLLEEQNIFKTHILGHSMGGKVAMQFAVFFQGFVDKLIIADIFPKSYANMRLEHEMIFEAIDIVNACKFKDRKEGEAKLKEVIQDERIFQFVLKNLKAPKQGCPEWKFNSMVLKREYFNMLENIHITQAVKSPTLFIKAENSNYILEEDFKHVDSLFPNAQLITMPGTTHWLHADKPEEFTEVVANYLSE